jgi:hypothetical protein
MPGDVAIAFTVAVDEIVNGPVYRVDDIEGFEPSVV